MVFKNLNESKSSFADIFKFYKRIAEQYTDHKILEYV